MGLFYPSAEAQLASIDYSGQALLNFVILVGLLIYIFVKNNYGFIKNIFSDALLFVLNAFMLASVFVSMDKTESVKHIIAVLGISLPTIIYFKTRGVDRLFQTLATFVAFLAFINLLYVIILPQYGIMSANHAGRWRGLFEHKNGSGPFFAIGFFIILHQMKITATPRFIFQAVALLISLVFVIMSGSSTGYISFALMVLLYPVMLWMFKRPNPIEKLAVLLLSCSIITLLYVVAGDFILNAMFGLIGRDATLTGRTEIWAPLVDISLDRPLLGYGIGIPQQSTFMELVQSQLTFAPKSAHNSYLDMILGIGYPGMLIFLLFILRTLLKPVMNPAPDKATAGSYAIGISILIVMLVIAVSSSGVFISRSVFWLMTLIGILVLYQAPSIRRVRIN